MRLLIMGLPGSGKTKLARELQALTQWHWFNADEARQKAEDWDFSIAGRLRQARRLKYLSLGVQNSIVDFVAPLKEQRDVFAADFMIWMNTVQECKYPDTLKLFEPPDDYDLMISDFGKIDLDHILREIMT